MQNDRTRLHVINFDSTASMPLNICRPQQTVDYLSARPVELQIKGRHDPAIIHRARVVVDSVCALGLLDLCCERQGTLSMRKDPLRTKTEERS